MSPTADRLIPTIALVVTSFAMVASAATMEERLNQGDHIHGLYPSKEHVVVHGDTLWDLSGNYLKDPFIWPEIWQVNPQIDDPDRIYPGNQVQLPGHAPVTPPTAALPHLAAPATPPTSPPTAEAAPPETPPAPPAPLVASTDRIAHSGWLAGLHEEVGMGRVLGSWHPQRKMLATDASLYLSLGNRDGVVAGDRFQIVEQGEVIRHPETDKPVGRLIRVVGEVELTEVHDATSSGRVIRTFAPITAGDRVMPLPSPPPVTEQPRGDGPDGLKATVVATPDSRRAIATNDVFFLDVGTDQQVHPGDHFYLIRDPSLASETAPMHYTSEAVVLDARAHTSTALITKSLTEAYVGNRATYATAPLRDIYHQ